LDTYLNQAAALLILNSKFDPSKIVFPDIFDFDEQKTANFQTKDFLQKKVVKLFLVS
jgi:hypothetical protein